MSNKAAVAKHYEKNKFEIQKARILKRIAEGSKPQKATLEKYGITLDEENKPEAKPENRGRPKGSHKGISIEHIKEYYKSLVDEGKMAKNSAKNYISRLRVVMKETKNCDIDDDLIPCLKKHDDFFKALHSQGYTDTTIHAHLQGIVKALHTYPSLKEKVSMKAYEEALREAKKKSMEETIQQSVEDRVPPFSEIKDKVFDNYPEGSPQRLLIDLYDEFTIRDDFGNIELITSKKEETDESQNYLNLRSKELILNDYKTKKTYGQQRFKVPDELMNKIKKSVKETPRTYLFASPTSNTKPAGKLSGMLSSIFKKIGVNGKGVIDLLRHAKISEELDGDNIKDKEKRRQLFEKMLHSPATQMNYLRSLE